MFFSPNNNCAEHSNRAPTAPARYARVISLTLALSSLETFFCWTCTHCENRIPTFSKSVIRPVGDLTTAGSSIRNFQCIRLPSTRSPRYFPVVRAGYRPDITAQGMNSPLFIAARRGDEGDVDRLIKVRFSFLLLKFCSDLSLRCHSLEPRTVQMSMPQKPMVQAPFSSHHKRGIMV